MRRLRCGLVRGLCFEAVRDGLEHGQAAAARRLPLLHALRSFRPDHNFLEKKKTEKVFSIGSKCFSLNL